MRKGVAIAGGTATRAPPPALASAPASWPAEDMDPALEAHLRKARCGGAVRRQFSLIPPENYTTTREVGVMCATYNVNGRSPPVNSEDIRRWLGVGCHADLVAVGFQEVVPLTTSNVVLGAATANCEAWDRLIGATLNNDFYVPGSGAAAARPSRARRAGSRAARDAAAVETGGGDAPEQSDASSRASDGAAEPEILSARLASLQQSGTEDEAGEGGEAVAPGRAALGPSEAAISPVDDTFLSPASSPGGLSSAASSTPDYLSGEERWEAPEYVRLGGVQLVGVYLTLWARQALLPHVRGLQTLTVGTGVLGYMGNKGAVALRLRVFDSPVVFVNAHLASGEAEADDLRRHLDYAEILRRGWFPAPEEDPAQQSGVSGAGAAGSNGSRPPEPAGKEVADRESRAAALVSSARDLRSLEAAENAAMAPAVAAREAEQQAGIRGSAPSAAPSSAPSSARPSTASDAAPPGPLSASARDPRARAARPTLSASSGDWGGAGHLLSAEHLFWVGDLNFRLAGVSGPSAVRAIREGRAASLLPHDQLRQAVAKGVAFAGWQEGPIAFDPTFKFRRGCTLYVGEEEALADDPRRAGPLQARASVPDRGSAPGNGAPAGLSAPRDAGHVGKPGAESPLAGVRCSGGKGALPPLSSPLEKSAASLKSLPSLGPLAAQLPGAVPRPAPLDDRGDGEAQRIRAPAWTDRVLFRSSALHGVRQVSYGACAAATLSDHRPVVAAFALRARTYEPPGVEAALELARRLADAHEMAVTPHLEAAPRIVEFGRLRFGTARPVAIRVRTGPGRPPAAWELIPTPGRSGEVPPWLELRPHRGMVSPEAPLTLVLVGGVAGGGSADATLRSCLALRREEGHLDSPGASPPSAPSLALSLDGLAVEEDGVVCLPLDAILVLRVRQGNDVFLACTASLELSCFGLDPGTTLRALPYPLQRGAAGDAGAVGEARRGRERLEEELPAEFRRLLDALRRPAALSASGIFLRGADEVLAFAAGVLEEEEQGPGADEPRLHGRIRGVRLALDAGEDWPQGCEPEDLAATLLALLAAMPAPLLPPAAHHVCDVAEPTAEVAAALVRDKLSARQMQLYQALMEVFQAVLAPEAAASNGVTAPALAAVLAEVLFKPLPGSNKAPEPGAAVTAAPGVGGDGLAAIAMRRIRFVQLLLRP